MATLRRSIAASVLFTVFGGPGVVLVLGPWGITGLRIAHRQPMGWQVVAWGLIGVGLVPLLESIVRFVRVGRGSLFPTVPTERLVVSGLYRWVRNPMYVGDVVVLLGEALLFRSAWMLAYTLAIGLGFDLFIRKYEEPTLQRRYGAEYTGFCVRVNRWWPRMPTKENGR